MGAKVIALDIDQSKLDKLSEVGITNTINTSGMDIKSVKKAVKEMAKGIGTFCVYMWVVIKALKHGACPYRRFTSKDENEEV